jgi:hypothetical protein
VSHITLCWLHDAKRAACVVTLVRRDGQIGVKFRPNSVFGAIGWGNIVITHNDGNPATDNTMCRGPRGTCGTELFN